MLRKLVVALVVVLASGLGSAQAADDPNGFVRNRVEQGQTLQDLLHGAFAVEVRCATQCLLATRIMIAQGPGKPYVEIGRTPPRKYYGGEWISISMPLNARGRAAVKAAESGLKIHGQTVATALDWTKNKDGGLVRRKGTASWVRTCAWPRR
jgi:hypothetical protein